MSLMLSLRLPVPVDLSLTSIVCLITVNHFCWLASFLPWWDLGFNDAAGSSQTRLAKNGQGHRKKRQKEQ